MDWDSLFKFAVGSTAITALLGFALKAYIKLFLDKDLERFKSQISYDVEEFKASLVRINNEHSIAYSKLHAERAEVINDVYGGLVELKSSLHSFLCPMQYAGEQTLSEKIVVVFDNYNSAAGYYFKNKIYLDPGLCEAVEKILEEVRVILFKVRNYPLEYDDPAYQRNSKLAGEKMNLMHDSWNKLNNEISSIQIDLENKFRTILGVKDTSDVS